MNKKCFIRSDFLLYACLLFLTHPVLAKEVAHDNVQVFRGAKIYPIASTPIENGALVIKNGKIIAVGENAQIKSPAGAIEIDVSGKQIMPGLVDTHSHIGRGDGGDRSDTVHPDVRIIDAIDARNSGFMKARAGGITTVNVMPGSGHLMSGQTAYLKLREAEIINDMLFCENIQTDICGGLKMANGTNSMKKPPFTGTRAKSAAKIRQLFIKAQEYQQKVIDAKGKKDKLPSRDIGLESLVEVLEGKRIVHHHTHRHDDVLTVIRIAKEFGFRVVLHHVSEAWKVADEIAASGFGASIIEIDSPGGKLEAVDLINRNGAELEKAGALVAYHTDDGITDSRWFLRSAAIGVRYGMSREKSLEAMTISGAKMLDLDSRIGSLEQGKDADFIILSGDPLSVYSHIEQTWIEGKNVFDLNNPEHKKYATGGYGVFNDSLAHSDHNTQESEQ